MNSRVACTTFDLPINTNLDNNHTLVFKKIRFYNSAVIFIRNAQLVIKATDGDVIDISPGSLCYIEKNLVIDVTLKVLGSGVPYDIYTIDSDILSSVCKVMEPILSGQHLVTQVRKRIFFINWKKQIKKFLDDLLVMIYHHTGKFIRLLIYFQGFMKLSHLRIPCLYQQILPLLRNSKKSSKQIYQEDGN